METNDVQKKEKNFKKYLKEIYRMFGVNLPGK